MIARWIQSISIGQFTTRECFIKTRWKILLSVILVPVVIFYADACRRLVVCSLHYFSSNQHYKNIEDLRLVDRTGIELSRTASRDNLYWANPDWGNPTKHDFANGPTLISDKGKYGYVDQKGSRAIRELFNRARPFSEGLAAVSDVKYSDAAIQDHAHLSYGSAPWHYIDETGKTAFSRSFARVSEFHCGRAIVTTLQRPWNPICINTKGETVFDNPKFMEIYPYSDDGYAIVSTGWPPETSGLIDKSGKLVIDNIRFANFAEGLGAYRDRKTGRFGYMDCSGTIVIAPQFFNAGRFSDGLAPVAIADTGPPGYEYSLCAKYSYGYIDKTGNLLKLDLRKPAGTIKWAGLFRDGQATVQLRTSTDRTSD